MRKNGCQISIELVCLSAQWIGDQARERWTREMRVPTKSQDKKSR